MKYKSLYSVLFITLALWSCVTKGKVESPNVVFIMVDDLGWKDLGFMGSEYYQTPNLDALAAESMVFTRAYAGAANCAPSRAVLNTGMTTPRTGVYTVSPSTRGDKRTRKIIPITNKDFIADSVITLAEMFQSQGYITGHFGKWHIGEDPLTQGFDVNVGGGPFGHPKSYFSPYIKPNIPAPKGEYLPNKITDEAINFISSNRDNKFFLYLPYYTVHTPIQGQQELIEKHKKQTGGQGQNNAEYATMVDNMDHNVGRILETLKQYNLDKNTLIVFTSDNGGVFGITQQQPLRAGKGSYYEGGIRVPMVIKWNNNIQPSINDTPISFVDFYPTFRNIIHAKKSNQPEDGIDLLPLLTHSNKLTDRSIFFHFPIYLQGNHQSKQATRDPLFRTRPGSVVIKDKWKIIHYYEDNSTELFNLENDINENHDLSISNPKKKEELLILMHQWIEKTQAPIPNMVNNHYDEKYETSKLNLNK